MPGSVEMVHCAVRNDQDVALHSVCLQLRNEGSTKGVEAPLCEVVWVVLEELKVVPGEVDERGPEGEQVLIEGVATNKKILTSSHRRSRGRCE